MVSQTNLNQAEKYFRKAIELIKNWNKEDLLIIQWTAPIRQELITSDGYLFYPPSNFTDLSYLYGQNVKHELLGFRIPRHFFYGQDKNSV